MPTAQDVCKHRGADAAAPSLASRWSDSIRVPIFCTAAQLTASPEWQQYLDWVYTVSTLAYPVDTREFAVFYAGARLPRAIAEAASPLPLSGNVAEQLAFGALYTTPHLRRVHGYSYIDYVYIHAFGSAATGERSPYALAYPNGLPHDTLVEVRHFCCDGCAVGFWMSVAPGSGVHYHLGRTRAFLDRLDACHHFFGRHHRTCLAWAAGRRRLFPPYAPEWQMILGLRHVARDAGLDSLQFVEGPGRGAEIVDLRDGTGSDTCEHAFANRPRSPPGERIFTARDKLVDDFFFAAHSEVKWSREEVRFANQSCHPRAMGDARELFRAGWRGATECACNWRLGALNCNGAPASQATWK